MTPFTFALLALPAMVAAGEPLAPRCSAVPGWTQEGPDRAFDVETLFDYMNGNAEGYFAYGFVAMAGLTCVNDAGDRFVIDVSEMGDADRAWGFFVANRDVRSPVEPIGSGGQVLPRRTTFAKGRHYVEIAAGPDKDHSTALRAFATALEALVPGRAAPPEAVGWFPEEGLEPGSIRLVPESVLGIRALRTGYLAQYAVGRAFVVPEETKAAAADTLATLRARFDDAAAAGGPGDEAFTASDPYLGGLLVFRKGPRVAGIANVTPGADPSALARRLAAALP